MARILLKDLTKKVSNVIAVNQINLEILDKEFVVLVGPSGCGKTTTLRMVAGLEELTGGNIFIGERMVNELAPKDRNLAMVFQNYALYPNMNVYDNMAYGLKMRKTPREEIKNRVQNAAEILGIEDLLERKPKQLSGGQRQRVAVGRAIVRQPEAFLFDEPLSNLDASLRIKMRLELKNLQRKLGITMILVTHDQEEALSMSDKIIVMEKGDILQTGSPQDIYFRPLSREVSSFIGRANFVDINGKHELIRPENIKIIPDDKGDYRIKDKIFMGARTEYIVSDGKNTLEVEMSGIAGTAFEKGQTVSIQI